MRLSIVIPTYRRRRTLERTFPTVAGQDLPNLEIIVVVDGSTDGSSEYLRGFNGVRVIEQSNQGPAAARNAGVAAASGDVVLFLDDDMVCPSDLARKHLEAHEACHERIVFCGPVWVSDESPKGPAAELTRRATLEGYQELEAGSPMRWPSHTIVDANSSVRKSLFLESGGFDPTYRRSETNELGFRLYRSEVRFEYLKDAAACQIFDKDSDQRCKDAALHARYEIKLAESFPQYRRFCALASLGSGTRRRRFARRALASLSPAILKLFSKVCSVHPGIGLRALQLREAAAMWRAAREEAGGWDELNRRFGKTVSVLLYHHVGPLSPGNNAGMSIPAAMFERQVQWLAKHNWTPITTKQWVGWVHGENTLPEKPVILTFDDALEDLTKYAFPVLRRHGFPGVCFVVTGKLGQLNDWAGDRTGHDRLMTISDVREWANAGIEFGAHTRTHPDLRTLDGEALNAEVAGSKRDLEEILGAKIHSFAYTYGDYDEASTKCAQRHFDCSFTCDEGLNTLSTEPHLLRRTMMSPFDWSTDLRLRLTCGRSRFIESRSRFRIRTRLRKLFGVKER